MALTPPSFAGKGAGGLGFRLYVATRVLILWVLLWVCGHATAQALPLIRLSQDQVTVSAGASVSVDVVIEGVTNLGSFQFNLIYDSEMVDVASIQIGDFLGSTGRQPNPLGPRTDRPGDTAFGAFTLGNPDQRGPDGAGRLVTVQLIGKKAGVTPLRLDRAQATTPQGQPLNLGGANAATVAAPVQPAQAAPPTARPAIPTVARPPVASPTPPDMLTSPGQGQVLVWIIAALVILTAVFVILRRRSR